jgi:hypothetical protein
MLPFLLRARRAALVVIVVLVVFFLLLIGCPSQADLFIFHNFTLIFVSPIHLNCVSIFFFFLLLVIKSLVFLLA